MPSPAEHLKDLLVEAGVGLFAGSATSTGWRIWVAFLPDAPDTSIVLYDTGGRASNPAWLIDFPTVQVLVRGKQGGYQDAWARAKMVKNALLGIPSRNVSDGRLVAINMLSDITFIGNDKVSRPELTINFALIIEPAMGTHRESL